MFAEKFSHFEEQASSVWVPAKPDELPQVWVAKDD